METSDARADAEGTRSSTTHPQTTDAEVSMTTPQPPALPDDPTPVVLLRVQGMFPVVPPFLPSGWTAVYPDGAVLAPFTGDAAALPQVWPYEAGRVDRASVEQLLAAAEDAGLLAEPAPGAPVFAPHISDAPRTTVVLTTVTGTWTHVADGLGIGAETDPYRAALRDLTGRIATIVMDALAQPLVGDTPHAFYEPTALDVFALDVTEAPLTTAQRHAVEWSAPNVSPADWTACTTIDDPEAVELLSSAMAGPIYTAGGRSYRIASRVHTPGSRCDR